MMIIIIIIVILVTTIIHINFCPSEESAGPSLRNFQSWGLPNGVFPKDFFAEVPQYTIIYIYIYIFGHFYTKLTHGQTYGNSAKTSFVLTPFGSRWQRPDQSNGRSLSSFSSSLLLLRLSSSLLLCLIISLLWSGNGSACFLLFTCLWLAS